MLTSKIETKITFKGMDSSDALKEYAAKKIEKISKHLHAMTHCDYVLSVEKNVHVVLLHVVSGDFEAKAEARSENMYASIDDVTDKMVQQTRKYKEKLTSHSGKPHHGDVAFEASESNED